ncbi:uncharacterized protein [Halyomorpha halys]|uniref:uncharacterized protein isoform X2 n=1 Tax=Halyomorpha halys TaxID=286706 RepID=UPI0034D376D8
MAILQSCCCWRSVRKGSYASAAYTTAYFTVTLVVMGKFLHQERHYWMGNVTAPLSESMLEETISPTTMVFNLIILACSSLGIVTSAILTYGLYCDNKILLIPWILTVMVTSMVDLAHSFFLFTTEKMKFEPTTAILFTIDFFLLSLNVYCLLCVVSQYQEYKAGRGTADFEYSNRRIPGVKYTPQPTGTSFLSTRRAVTYHETKASPTGSPPRPTQVGRKHVQWGGEAPQPAPPPAIIHMESPKDSGRGRYVQQHDDAYLMILNVIPSAPLSIYPLI